MLGTFFKIPMTVANFTKPMKLFDSMKIFDAS